MKRWVASLATLATPLARAHPHPQAASAATTYLGPSMLRLTTQIPPLMTCITRCLNTRGGGGGDAKAPNYVKLDDPAPGSPFHHAFPVHDLAVAKEFYGTVLGCKEGRSSEKWQDYSLNGHQIVCHWVGNDYRCQDYYNPVDGDEVPVPHFGLALTVEQFHDLAERVRKAGVKFIIEPHLRFEGMPGEQVCGDSFLDQYSFRMPHCCSSPLLILSVSHSLFVCKLSMQFRFSTQCSSR